MLPLFFSEHSVDAESADLIHGNDEWNFHAIENAAGVEHVGHERHRTTTTNCVHYVHHHRRIAGCLKTTTTTTTTTTSAGTGELEVPQIQL